MWWGTSRILENKIEVKGTFKIKTEIGTILTKHYMAYI